MTGILPEAERRRTVATIAYTPGRRNFSEDTYRVLSAVDSASPYRLEAVLADHLSLRLETILRI